MLYKVELILYIIKNNSHILLLSIHKNKSVYNTKKSVTRQVTDFS